ncbi:dynamin-related protein 3A-like isoform X4 [Malus sylvestris]|uniref:dynamin-related protein 3A-like isoform X4 n=1 Tax=Malus sylvestris TaxID=3752 RepID=UPI0021AD36A2|nr:dynamin-related protein 3A-like isoform X4 [Malus sylvestris]
MGEEAREVGSSATSPRPSVTIGSSLISMINKLQDILAPVVSDKPQISLPQVAVVGSQSSGKSSVLEALVGRDFLPRGRDICTRRPLVLMLEYREEEPGDEHTEWGEFRHLPGKRFYDFSAIRREIQAETDREAGLNKGVSDKQIRLKITSPNVLNMTLVDLPGITKVPVGDQPRDIEAMIRKMIMDYITQQNCIILAVSPANSDLATSDALQMAREADPNGFRTIGVITKLDIMDRGTDACNFLLGKVIPLKLGYVGVVNRSQEDINKNRGIAAALAYEEKFFNEHPVYSNLSDRCGMPQLARNLNQILEQHIKRVLPDLKARLNSQMVSVSKELQAYGQPLESKMAQGVVLLNILTKYCEAFAAMLEGKSQEMSTKELSGGARIHYILQSIFVKSLEGVDPCDDLTDDDIRTAIQNASGAKNALFVPEVPFEFLVRRQIARLLDPSCQCLHFVYDELVKISRACEVIELQRFPVLRKCLDEVVVNFLREGAKPALRMIENLIEMEVDYINTSHPRFIGGKKASELAMQQLKAQKGVTDVEGQTSRTVQAKTGSRPQLNNENPVSSGKLMSTISKHTAAFGSTRTWGIPSIFGSRTSAVRSGGRFGEQSHSESMPSTINLREPPSILRPTETTDNEAAEIIITKLLLQSYYDIVRKNMQDLVPKAIMHFLVNSTKQNLQTAFIQKLYRENMFDELLKEHDELVSKRKRNEKLFEVFKQSLQTLEKVEFDVSSQTSSLGTDFSVGLPRIPSTLPDLHKTSEIIQFTHHSFSMPYTTDTTA